MFNSLNWCLQTCLALLVFPHSMKQGPSQFEPWRERSPCCIWGHHIADNCKAPQMAHRCHQRWGLWDFVWDCWWLTFQEMVVELIGKDMWLLGQMYGLDCGCVTSCTLLELWKKRLGNRQNLGQYNVVLGQLACSFLPPSSMPFPRLDCNPA